MLRLFMVLISLLSTGESFSAEIANLYQGSIPVISQSEEERKGLTPQILRQVILKVVGDRSVLDVIDLSQILSKANDLAQQFQYERINKVEENLTQPDRLALRMIFNETRLNQSLTSLNLPVWGHTRPDVLVWLALDDGQQREIIGSGSKTYNIPEILNRIAERRGLPLFMPVMDLKDQSQIRFSDIWGGFLNHIETSSYRYAPAVTVVVRLSLGRQALAHWHAIINGESEKWQSRGELETALNSGIEELTDRIARRFTQVISNEQYKQQLVLGISNVNDYANFSRIMQYLKQLQYVTNVQLQTITAEQVTVNIALKGDLNVFKQTLTLGGILQEGTGDSIPPNLYYRLLP